jgi:hypothetical protein
VSRNAIKGVVRCLGALLFQTDSNTAVALMTTGLSLPYRSLWADRDVWFVVGLPVFHTTLLDWHGWDAAPA